MAIFSGPNILVEDGLEICLDAANFKSYPGTGTAWTDLSGNSYNGTLVNGVGYDANNLGFLDFDGVNDFISIPSPSNRWTWTPSGVGNNNMTIEMWVKSTDTSGWYVSKPWNGNGEYNYGIQSGSWTTRVATESHSLSFSTLATGNWEHIACITTPTEKAVYRNGKLNVGFVNHNITLNTPTNGNGNIALALMTLYPYGGAWAGNTGFSIIGNLSNFKIYNRALPSNEILQNYNAIKGRYGIIS